MSLIIEPVAFRLESGSLKEFVTTADSGREKTCAFCPECGVRINNATSALMSIKAGTRDDTSWLRPNAQYWARRRQPWLLLPPTDVPVFEQAGRERVSGIQGEE